MSEQRLICFTFIRTLLTPVIWKLGLAKDFTYWMSLLHIIVLNDVILVLFPFYAYASKNFLCALCGRKHIPLPTPSALPWPIQPRGYSAPPQYFCTNHTSLWYGSTTVLPGLLSNQSTHRLCGGRFISPQMIAERLTSTLVTCIEHC